MERHRFELGQVYRIRCLAGKTFGNKIEFRVIVRGTEDIVEVGPFVDAAPAITWAQTASTLERGVRWFYSSFQP